MQNKFVFPIIVRFDFQVTIYARTNQLKSAYILLQNRLSRVPFIRTVAVNVVVDVHGSLLFAVHLLQMKLLATHVEKKRRKGGEL